MRWVLDNFLFSLITLMYLSFQKTVLPTETEGVHYLNKFDGLFAENIAKPTLEAMTLLPKMLAKE